MAFNGFGGLKYLTEDRSGLIPRPKRNNPPLLLLNGKDLRWYLCALYRHNKANRLLEEPKQKMKSGRESDCGTVMWLIFNSVFVDLAMLTLVLWFLLTLGPKLDMGDAFLSWWLVMCLPGWGVFALLLISIFYDHLSMNLATRVAAHVKSLSSWSNSHPAHYLFFQEEPDDLERVRRDVEWSIDVISRGDGQEFHQDDVEELKIPSWRFLFQDRRGSAAFGCNSWTTVLWSRGFFSKKSALVITVLASLSSTVLFPLLLTLYLEEDDVSWLPIWLVLLPFLLGVSVSGIIKELFFKEDSSYGRAAGQGSYLIFLILMILKLEGALDVYWSVIFIALHVSQVINLQLNSVNIFGAVFPVGIVLTLGLKLDHVGELADFPWSYLIPIFLSVFSPFVLGLCLVCTYLRVYEAKKRKITLL